MLENLPFLSFIRTFGITRNNKTGFAQVSSSVQADEMRKVVDQLVDKWLKQLEAQVDENGYIVKE